MGGTRGAPTVIRGTPLEQMFTYGEEGGGSFHKPSQREWAKCLKKNGPLVQSAKKNFLTKNAQHTSKVVQIQKKYIF